ncbi:MAG: GntR family transcriptional regulator [Rhodospirillaceae bacterium]|jgi:DNA-binding GntR family transcriptional regulator|nr:GntR family transcriptional regulator [Rhodospirillaceae bacterium]MBT6119070.1 GntR family transcriptional regulator [Rhodospirillaceae bacterium]
MSVIAKPESIARQVYRLLRGRIMAGEISGGAVLTGVELARELEVSRTPIREALLLLEADGLVAPSGPGGAAVTDLRSALAEVMEMREALEGYAARKATERADAATIRRLDALCDEAETLGHDDVAERARLNRAFHELLVGAAGNARLARAVHDQAEYFAFAARLYDTATAAESLRDHRRMVGALKARDGALLERIIHDHLARALRAVRKQDETKPEKGAKTA